MYIISMRYFIKKALPWALILLAAIAAAAFLFSRSASQPVALEIFAYDDCGGCFAGDNPCKPCVILEELQVTYYGILEQAGIAQESRIRIVNLRGESGQEAFRAVRERLDVAEEQVGYPFVILDETTWFAGETAPSDLSQKLKNRGLSGLFAPKPQKTASFSNDEIVYFYSEFCGDCVRAARYLDQAEAALLEAGLTVTRHCVDTDEGYALLTDYLSDYGLGHKSATVPYLFRGQSHYFGSSEIGAILAQWPD